MIMPKDINAFPTLNNRDDRQLVGVEGRIDVLGDLDSDFFYDLMTSIKLDGDDDAFDEIARMLSEIF